MATFEYRSGGSGNNNGWQAIVGILTLALFFVGMYYVARGVTWLLTLVAPVLLIAPLIIDYKVVTGYLSWVGGLFKRNVLWGIGAGLLTVFGFAFVSAFLFGKAMLKRKARQMREDVDRQRRGEFIEYEEVKDEADAPLQLPPLRRPEPASKPKPKGNEYDQLFN